MWTLGPAGGTAELLLTLPGTGATLPRCQPNQLGSRAVPLLRAVPCADRASSGVSAESDARGAVRSRACVHAHTLGTLSRAEVNSTARVLALEEVRGLGMNSRTRHLNARHGPQERGRTRVRTGT